MGVGGYSAAGTITYDSTLPTVSASGPGPTNGIDFLDVTMFDPSNVPFQSTVNVAGGISSYNFLVVTFDTASMLFTFFFDIGKDDTIAGDTWITGFIGGPSQMVQLPVGTIDVIPNSTTITVTAVPEPTTTSLLAIGLLGAGFAARRRRVGQRPASGLTNTGTLTVDNASPA